MCLHHACERASERANMHAGRRARVVTNTASDLRSSFAPPSHRIVTGTARRERERERERRMDRGMICRDWHTDTEKQRDRGTERNNPPMVSRKSTDPEQSSPLQAKRFFEVLYLEIGACASKERWSSQEIIGIARKSQEICTHSQRGCKAFQLYERVFVLPSSSDTVIPAQLHRIPSELRS